MSSTTALKATRFSWRASTSRLRRIGMPAFTRVASCRVKTASPFPLIGRPNDRGRLRCPAPATGNVIFGPLPGAFAAKVGDGGGAAGAARTESLAIRGKTEYQITTEWIKI